MAKHFDISTKPTSLYLLSSPPPSEQDSVSAATISQLDYLAILFILQPAVYIGITQTNKVTAKDGAREIEFGLLDGGDDGEHNGVVYVGIAKRFAFF